jgi:phage baseplate assembly protein W
MANIDIPGVQHADLHWGESLQELAARTLGDATQWVLIAELNGLLPPYVTSDKSLVSPSVVLYGTVLMIPSGSGQISASTDPSLVFEIDIALLDGEFVELNGDIATVSGIDNLAQALNNRVVTETGELDFHLDYGCKARKLMGVVGGPTGSMVSGEYVRAALKADPRVQDVSNVVVTVSGDVTDVDAIVTPITGKSAGMSFQI